MRKTSTNHWSKLDKLESLLFFAQSVDEMLYDFTLDSFKPLALNTRLLCIECLTTIEEVNGDFMPKRNLQSILEELRWSLEKDTAAKVLLGKKFDYYLRKIKPTEIKIKELQTLIEHIYNFLNEQKYLNQIKLSLKDLIVQNKEKEKIKRLTNSFLSELINYGYNPSHIDFQTNSFFFNVQKVPKINSIEQLEDYFKLFDFERKEFIVAFSGSFLFTKFKSTLNNFDVVVTKNYNCFSTMKEDIEFKNNRKTDESFIICSKIKELDHHSAKETAEKFLAQATNLFNFFHHNQKPEINNKSVVCRVEDNYVVIIDQPIKSILKTKDNYSPDRSAKKVEEVLKNLDLERESLFRFTRCIDLHSAALSTSAIENQILDLWASVETLIPKSSELNQDRIVQISSKLIPFLQLNYPEKLFRQLLQDLYNWNLDETKKILKETIAVDSKNNIEKIAAFIALKDNEENRKKLYAKLDDFPLLKFRIFELHKLFNSPSSIQKTLNKHHIKLEWHLRRIYRTRSLIIHSGTYPTYTPILIEHLHNYLDIMLSKIIELASKEKSMSIEHIILEIKILLEYQTELLEKHIKEELTKENFKEVVFGIEK